jgi:tetratricopeptide (TPR) repeat protein
MLDALEKFQTVREGDLILRFSPEEAAVMKEYAVPFAKAAVESLTKQWGFTPKGPLIIEMFPKHDDFAVRTMGLPGMVGALGVCFGTVVALDSPRARPPGDFSWQETLLHELTHVMTIQLSNNRVPRWLTEGVSVWSERQGRGDWGRETHVPFARALDQGKILKLKDLNEGFQDPQMIVLAYYQASLVVDHLVATYGQPKLRDFVQAFSRGLDLDGAFRAAYGVGVDDVQKGFDAALERDFGTLRKALRRVEVPATASVDDLRKLAAANPDSFLVHMRLADALRKSKDNTGALAALDRAAALVPQATGDASPHVGIATIALELKDTPRALRALDAFLAVDPNNVEWARRRAELVEPLGDARRTEAAFQRVVDADPFDTRAQTMVGRLSLARRDGATAARAFRAALAGQPADRAAAHLDLAKAYLATGQKAEAKQEALAALEIAPTYEAAQDVLLQVVGG